MNEAAAPRHRTGADRRAVAAAVALPPASTRGAHRTPPASGHAPSTMTRIGQGGVVAALLVAFALAVMNPVQAAPSDLASPVPTLARETRDRLAAIEQTRADLADVTATVLARVEATRLDAVEAQVSADQLAALLELSEQVDELSRRMRGESTAASRSLALSASTERVSAVADLPASSSSATGTTATATVDGATADPDSAGTTATSPADALADTSADAAPAALAIAGEVSPTFVDLKTVPLDAAALDDILAAVPQVLATDDADAAALREAVVALATEAADVFAVAEANRAAAAAAAAQAAREAAEKEAAEKAAAAAEDARRKSLPRSAEGYLNGEIPASALCHPSSNPSALLRCDAAEAFDQMDAAYVAAFGTHLVIGSSYRSYAEQVACRASQGYMCADPGTSNHGWGLAVDLAGDGHNFNTPTHQWLEANAATYGWSLPSWAVQGGGKEEPWHWEFGV